MKKGKKSTNGLKLLLVLKTASNLRNSLTILFFGCLADKRYWGFKISMSLLKYSYHSQFLASIGESFETRFFHHFSNLRNKYLCNLYNLFCPKQQRWSFPESRHFLSFSYFRCCLFVWSKNFDRPRFAFLRSCTSKHNSWANIRTSEPDT